MINSIIPLADWGMGTALIIVFALVCVVLTVVVVKMVMGGSKETEDQLDSDADASVENIKEAE